MITQEELKSCLYYDQATGVFTWKKYMSASAKAGDVAGGIVSTGYRVIGLFGKTYLAHRLAWLYVFGYFPEGIVDHINREPSDNRICNLREATQSCNMRNSKVSTVNRSGVKGVSIDKKKWRAVIVVRGKQLSLGRHRTKLEAAKARWLAERKYGWPNCDTISSALAYIKEVSP